MIDSSALLAILLDEADATLFLDRLSRDAPKPISITTLLESQIVTLRMLGEDGLQELRLLLHLRQIIPIQLTPDQVEWALQGWQHHGKGRHAARLNQGDRLGYALAKAREEPLLYRGDDFGRTDEQSVDLPT